MVSETERADIPRIPRKQRRPRYVYLMPLDQQLAWSMPSLFFLMIGVAMTVACAAWPTWFSGVRNVNGTIEIGYLSSTKVCKENNLTRLVTCFTYAEEFDGTTPSAITFFWVGLGYLLVCCAIGISASEWFLIQSQDPEHLKLTNWALRASALSAIPIFPLKSWAAIYYNVNHSTSAGPYLILVALSSVALAYCFTSFSTRQICVFMDDRMERMVESRDKPSIFRRFAARPATVVTGRKAAGGEQKGMVRIVRDAAKGKVKRVGSRPAGKLTPSLTSPSSLSVPSVEGPLPPSAGVKPAVSPSASGHSILRIPKSSNVSGTGGKKKQSVHFFRHGTQAK